MDGQEKQQDMKKEKVFTPEETFTLQDGWNGLCEVPRGWMAKEKQQNLTWQGVHSWGNFQSEGEWMEGELQTALWVEGQGKAAGSQENVYSRRNFQSWGWLEGKLQHT